MPARTAPIAKGDADADGAKTAGAVAGTNGHRPPAAPAPAERIVGAALLDDLAGFLGRYVAFPGSLLARHRRRRGGECTHGHGRPAAVKW
jgi:hypothetical protein